VSLRSASSLRAWRGAVATMPGAGEYSHDRRDETLTPPVGTFRPHKNTLLLKPNLGAVKGTCYDLPSKQIFQHEYGLRQVRDGVTSADVVGNWAAHEPNPNVQPGRDFKTLNKQAVVEGATSCKDIHQYRNTHDFRLKLGTYKKEEKKPYDADTSFGRPTQSASSFNDLFCHSYRYDWVAEHAGDNAPTETKKKKPQMTKSAIALQQCNATRMMEKVPEVEWKMSAFTTVPPKVGYTG